MKNVKIDQDLLDTTDLSQDLSDLSQDLSDHLITKEDLTIMEIHLAITKDLNTILNSNNNSNKNNKVGLCPLTFSNKAPPITTLTICLLCILILDFKVEMILNNNNSLEEKENAILTNLEENLVQVVQMKENVSSKNSKNI